MKNLRKLFILVCLIATSAMAKAQQNEVIQKYIDEYKVLAIEEMQRTGVPAAIKLAQGIHETLAGTSPLVLKSNNHFGIKCKSNWTGESVSHDDDARGECFRKYPSADDSYRDHSNFLKANQRYAFLFELEPTDYRGWAHGLKKAGYATNPRYPAVIIKLVEEYQLQDYSLIALGKISDNDTRFTKTDAATTPESVPPAPAPEDTDEAAISQPSYPENQFEINETKVVFVKKGTPYLTVAKQYNVSLSRIFEFNDMKPCEMAASDQLVYLQRKRKVGKADFHIVRPGESLHDIAQAEAIRLEALQQYNWLDRDMQPAVGERLSLRGKSPVMPKIALKNNYSIGSPLRTRE